MTEQRARKIAALAAIEDAPEDNKEYDYFLSVLMQKISVDLSKFLREDFTK